MKEYAFLEVLLNECQMLQNTITKHRNEVSFELFSQWRENQQSIGNLLVNEAFSYIASKYKAYILCNPVNPVSFAHFTRKDVQSKICTLRERTARGGIQNGFIASSSSCLKTAPLKFFIGNDEFAAVERDGKELITACLMPQDLMIEVGCYSDNSYIISDIDLLFILFQESSSYKIVDPEFGELTIQEKSLILDLNFHFQGLVQKKIKGQNLFQFKLIAHGPANRFSQSKASHIHYPITVYTPQGHCQFIGDESKKEDSLPELLNFLKTIELNGYFTFLNPKWNF